jgi:multidrug efflux system outer membrane protein
MALVGLRRERAAAWIALYRAMGGGWSRADAAASASATQPGPASYR